MRVLLAATPILLVLILMIARGWTAARAGVAGLAVTAVLAVGAFGLGTDVRAADGVAGAVGGALAEALFTSASILWIIVPALGVHQLQLRTGGTDALRDGLGSLSADPRVVALLVAWFFALFMEGAAGFGASVALAAPFLVGAGFSPVGAVVAAMIGHAVGVSFGAVGTPVLPQVEATGLAPVALSRVAGTMHLLLGWVLLVLVMRLVDRMIAAGEGEGLAARATLPAGRVWALTAAAAGLFLLPYAAIARLVGPELPTLGGALVGGAAFVWLLRRTVRPAPDAPGAVSGAVAPAGRVLLRAGVPYLVLVGVILLTRMIPPIQDAARSVTWSWALGDGFSGQVQPLYHPGSAIAVGLVAGLAVQRLQRVEVAALARATLSQLGPVVIALIGMLGLSRLMVAAGMTDVLALAAAGAAGTAWPLLTPLVGALGTFVTGSATASNILFTDFQVGTARALDLPVAVVVGGQGFGAAVGNVVCPHNVVAAGATVGLAGEEGQVLRRTLWVALLYAGLGGVLALLLTGPLGWLVA